MFIHKVDGLSDDTKMETQRDIHQRANDDIIESGLEQQVGEQHIAQHQGWRQTGLQLIATTTASNTILSNLVTAFCDGWQRLTIF